VWRLFRYAVVMSLQGSEGGTLRLGEPISDADYWTIQHDQLKEGNRGGDQHTSTVTILKDLGG